MSVKLFGRGNINNLRYAGDITPIAGKYKASGSPSTKSQRAQWGKNGIKI